MVAYPPFSVQYPTGQASVIVARFSTVRPSKGPSSVGVGTALATPANRADAILVNLMIAILESPKPKNNGYSYAKA